MKKTAINLSPFKTAQKIKEIFKNASIDYKSRFQQASEEARNFISSCSMSTIRNDTMGLLNAFSDVGGNDDDQIIHQILEQIIVYYDTKIKISCHDASEMNTARYEKVTDNVWKDCFKIILELDITKYQTEIDNLLHLKEPETQFRKDFIRSSILLMVYDENIHKFCKGIFFAAFCEEVIDDVFDVIIYKIYIYGHSETLEPFLSTTKLKMQYLNLLNDCLRKSLDQHPQENIWAEKFISKIDINKLPELIEHECKKYGMKPRDAVETCMIFGKVYQLIIVATTKQLQKFVEKCFIETCPKMVGLSTESKDGKLAILQLATHNWLCIIDIHLLPKQDWVKFFKHIFDAPSITPIGFAVGSDFRVLCNTISCLKDYFKKQSRKMLCISKLIQLIQQNPQAKAAIYSKKQINGNNLKDVSDAVLGGNLNKNLANGTSWTQRPLTKEQKLYAVTDALVVVLIKEKIEKMLKGKLNPANISKLLNDSYSYYGIKPPQKPKTVAVVRPNIQPAPSNIPPLMSVIVKPLTQPLSNLCIATEFTRSNSSSSKQVIKCKKCASTNIFTIPSPLYILTHKIITMIKDGEYYGLAEWKDLEKCALNVKNMSCSDYDNFKAKLSINDSTKPSKQVIFDCGSYQILPLTYQLLRKSDGKSFNLILSEKVFAASKHGVSHLLCLNCSNVFLKDENVQSKGSNSCNAKKNLPKKHVVKEDVTRQKIFELLCEVFEH